ncbi:Cro/CI family transcriptional regulator [Brenneria tiliae]|uniref:Cro/CI family transcriptional regulator n=1 Tax=Brenneria tiliae TaxID=2914984 RepID=UPI0020148F2A|nr:Cro/CI family transcriptional regulator [Brenneria tiliae]MCL2899761.1 Cro/CI family transcriptional regulator [Brenneria tiliae]MCL2904750.1 Cro/CI family transcriptional regulator [Brenneria tiliae]
MYKSDAIKYFGNLTKLADAAGVKLPSASAWGEIIPERRAARLERLTNGALKYDPALYQNRDGLNKGAA